MAPMSRHDQDHLLAQQAQALALKDIADQLAQIASGIDSLVGKHDAIDHGQLRVVIDSGKLTVRTDG
jgi:hypothetical protein